MIRFSSLILLLVWTSAQATNPFPTGPDEKLTPGSLCESRKVFRYPEQIPYCERSVGSGLKQDIIRTYDSVLGYQIVETGRNHFKIDHYIPLCMGGSNDRDNLWPQHESVYVITDKLEQVSCDKMAQGRLKQEEAVRLIRQAKGNLSLAPKILADLQGR